MMDFLEISNDVPQGQDIAKKVPEAEADVLKVLESVSNNGGFLENFMIGVNDTVSLQQVLMATCVGHKFPQENDFTEQHYSFHSSQSTPRREL